MDFVFKMAGGGIAAFVITLILLKFRPGEKVLLGHDRGRKFAQGSEVNIGKPTGVGFYFILVFLAVASVLCFVLCPTVSDKGILESGNVISGLGFGLLAVLAEMVTGWLDDRSKNPWNEYIKVALDVAVSLVAGLICVHFFGTRVYLAITGTYFDINPILYYFLAVLLFVVSINATNATDGIDGLSGALSVVAVIATLVMSSLAGSCFDNNPALLTVAFGPAISAYLAYNYNPSKMMMGDAGSRSLGFFIAFFLILCRIPFLYFIVGLPFLCDGGISILKITVGRLTNKKIILFKNITTPLHDELRKNRKFSSRKVWVTLVLAAVIVDVIYICVSSLIRVTGIV